MKLPGLGMRRARGNLAVDIGSGQIKMVAVEGAAERPKIAAVGIEPLPTDAIVGGEVMDYHLVVDRLRALRGRLGIKGKSVATSVSGRDVIVKRIKMDRMKEQEAQQVIRWEAEQHVPFDMDSVSLDFEILDPEADGLQMEVLLVAAKRDLVETRMRLLEDAGLQTAVIDIDAFAVQTAFEHGYEHASYGTFCMVNVGREITNLNLVEGGSPILTRDLALGERKFAEVLVRDLEISLEDAEGMLRGHDALEPRARQALGEAIEGLVTPIERARTFLSSSEGSRAKLDEIVLSGGGASIPGLAETIGERLSVPVTTLDALRGLDVDPAAQEMIREHGGAAALAVAVGLGLRGKE
jgi:type IV pilus assembly protein PilM